MELRQFLIDSFGYNDLANRKIIEKISELPDKNECIRQFSHIINSMNKWINALNSQQTEKDLDWWEPLYTLGELEARWLDSLNAWIQYLERMNDESLSDNIEILNFDGGNWEVKPKDIAIQLIFHSVHHAAQIQYLIRRQGVEPEIIDFLNDKHRYTKAD